MRIITGTYTGNGSSRRVSVGARPQMVWTLGDAAQRASWHTQRMWCGRSNSFADLDSINKGCSITDDGFVIGDSAQWNAAATVYHYVAFIPTDTSDFDVVSYIGNATAGTSYVTPQQRQVVAAIIKRDSALSGVAVTSNSAAATLSSLVAGTFVSALGVGTVTVTAESEVNQLDGPGALGEGTDIAAFYAGSTVTTAAYSGNLATGTVVATAPSVIKAALVYRVTNGGASARFITDTTSGKTKPASAAALQSGELAIVGNTLTVGAPGTGMNTSSVQYGVIVFSDGAKTPRAPAVIKSKGKRAVWLSGVSSNIDCGTAGGALLISGPISVEWMGAMYPTASNTTDNPLLVRSGGSFQTANSASWGIDAFRSADGAFAWPGLQANVCTSDRFINAPDIRSGWRTGVALPYGKQFHVIASHLGGGLWRFYLNGELVKQRQIDAVATVALANIASTAGHKTTIGARWNGTVMGSPQKMLHRIGRVYSVGLSGDEAATRYAIAMLGSSLSDVTRGMAEEWDAQNAAGIYLPATISSANNGTISGGSVITI